MKVQPSFAACALAAATLIASSSTQAQVLKAFDVHPALSDGGRGGEHGQETVRRHQ
jgi:hypothetical protein